jgi:hypothetical protein
VEAMRDLGEEVCAVSDDFMAGSTDQGKVNLRFLEFPLRLLLSGSFDVLKI